MSEVMLTIIDAQRALHDTQHGSIADAIVAALASEPETIEELEVAVTRFIKPTSERSLFASFFKGVNEEAWDAGIVIVDLAARIIAAESTYSAPGRTGTVTYHNGQHATDVALQYELSEDWLVARSIEQWRWQAEERRAARAAYLPLEARSILFGKALSEFIARECLQAYAAGAEDPIAELHTRWLLTPREDLRGQTPRAVLLAKRNYLDTDLNWRCHQWSFLGECPPGIEVDSVAYRHAGFGTHENIVYYELVRHLLGDCWQRVPQVTEVNAEIERLERVKNDWLYSPNKNYFAVSFCPIYVIEQERLRLPIAIGGARHTDENCAHCQGLAHLDMGPMFWHLDGSSMDDGYVFSFHRTPEDYEAEQREWQAFNEKFERERQERLARGEPEFPGYEMGDDYVFAEDPAYREEEPDKPEYLC